MLRNQVSMKVEGLAALEGKLKLLLNDTQQVSTLRGALRAGGRVFIDAMKSRVRRTSGQAYHATGKKRPHVADDLKVRFKRDRGLLTAHIGAGRQTAYIANMLERTGAIPHDIYAKPGKSLYVAGQLVQHVSHPGMQPSPFIRPAFDTQKENAIAAFRQFLIQRIERVVGRR